MNSGWARIALYLAPHDPYAAWYREAFDHAGMRADLLGEWMPSELARTHVLLLCGSGKLNNLQAEGVSAWVENGGILICTGSTWGLEAILGLNLESGKHCSSGVVRSNRPDRLWPEDAEALRFFGGTQATANGAQELAHNGEQLLLSRYRYGKGHAIFWGAHVGQTMQQMQMGRSVECDGIGPADDSARFDNGKLRSEDGIALDFEKDRETHELGGAPFFGVPYADFIKEIWIRAILQAVDLSGHATPVFWTWPNLAPAVATLTLDVRTFEVDRVIAMQRLLTMFGCPAAWMIAMPGYTADVYRVLRAMEHEVGLLFQIEDPGGWQSERLKIQLTNLGRLASWPFMGSVRIDDGQWKGWSKFYESGEAAGARVSLNKGGRQPGTLGFPFGTCHPFFPIGRNGESTVYEIPGAIWEPGSITSEHVAARLVDRVAARFGCLSLGLTPETIQDLPGATALRRILSACKDQRFLFTKPDELSKFERGRRQLRVSQKQLGEVSLLQLASEIPIPGLSLLVTGAYRGRVNKQDLEVRRFERFGTQFTAFTFDVPAKSLVDVELEQAPAMAQAA